MSRLSGKQVVVIGASGGVGREIVATALAEGANVLGVARNAAPLAALVRDFPALQTLALDAADDDAPNRVFAAATPDLLVVSGGARPNLATLQFQSWQDFSRNWNVDVKASLLFCVAALRKPLAPGSTVVLISSGAGLGGSRLSGGYAGAKRMQMFLAEYAQEESDSLKLGIRFLTVVPRWIMSTTELGRAAIEGYSSLHGITPEQFVARIPSPQTPQDVANAILELSGETEPREGNVFSVSSSGIEAVA